MNFPCTFFNGQVRRMDVSNFEMIFSNTEEHLNCNVEKSIYSTRVLNPFKLEHMQQVYINTYTEIC
jgi:hypothetical protein